MPHRRLMFLTEIAGWVVMAFSLIIQFLLGREEGISLFFGVVGVLVVAIDYRKRSRAPILSVRRRMYFAEVSLFACSAVILLSTGTLGIMFRTGASRAYVYASLAGASLLMAGTLSFVGESLLELARKMWGSRQSKPTES